MTITIAMQGNVVLAQADQAGQASSPTDTDATHSQTGMAHEAGGGHEAFPPFDPTYFASQLLWLAIMFGLFFWFMSRVAIPRVAGILEVRRDRISGDIDEAQRMRDEADAAQAAYEQELAEARARGHAIAQEATDKAKAEAEAERKRVEQQLSARLAEAEAHIARIRSDALGEVDKIASDTAGAIVNELIGGTASKAEIARAVSAVPREQG